MENDKPEYQIEIPDDVRAQIMDLIADDIDAGVAIEEALTKIAADPLGVGERVCGFPIAAEDGRAPLCILRYEHEGDHSNDFSDPRAPFNEEDEDD